MGKTSDSNRTTGKMNPVNVRSTGSMRAISKPPAHQGSISRNALCPCGSGKKYKHCCALKAYKAVADPPKKKFWRPLTCWAFAFAFAVAILVGALRDVTAGLWVFAAELALFFIWYALSDPPPPHTTEQPSELPPPMTAAELKELERRQVEAMRPRRRQIPR